MQKLSQAIIIPIILLSFAGLLLGLGTEITNILDRNFGIEGSWTEHSSAYIFPIMLKTIGDIVFSNLGLFFAIAIAIAFTNDAGIAGFSAFIGWIIFNAFQVPFIHGISSLNFSFYEGISNGLLTKNMGIPSLQTSLFGGVVVGFVVALIYNKFHVFKLPTILSFFSGTRLVPIMTFLLMPILAIYFLLFYPLLGIGLNHLGTLIGSMSHQEVSFFLSGTIDKILIPFGLQDIFVSSFELASNEIASSFNSFIVQYSVIVEYSGIVDSSKYIQVNYPISIFALPAAGIAMILTTKNANRKVFLSTLTLAIITTFLTGISEPLEFFMLFWTPFLYFGFHIWMAGISLAFMNLNFLVNDLDNLSIYGGLIDFILFGMKDVVVWPIILFGIIYFIIYFAIFYLYGLKFKFKLVDERTDRIFLIEQNFAYINKLKEQGIDPETGIELERSKRIQEILKNVGGYRNLTTIDACITRLRLTVVDKNKINEDNLKKLGAKAITTLGYHGVQIIFGTESDQIKTDLITYNNHLQERFEFNKSLEIKNNQNIKF